MSALKGILQPHLQAVSLPFFPPHKHVKSSTSSVMIVKLWIKATVCYNEESTQIRPQAAFTIGATRPTVTAFTACENRQYWCLPEEIHIVLI